MYKMGCFKIMPIIFYNEKCLSYLPLEPFFKIIFVFFKKLLISCYTLSYISGRVFWMFFFLLAVCVSVRSPAVRTSVRLSVYSSLQNFISI